MTSLNPDRDEYGVKGLTAFPRSPALFVHKLALLRSPCKTFKYLAALAIGVQPVDPSWVEDSVQDSILQPVGTYGLSAGINIEMHKSYDRKYFCSCLHISLRQENS